jgi:hypothetical protein
METKVGDPDTLDATRCLTLAWLRSKFSVGPDAWTQIKAALRSNAAAIATISERAEMKSPREGCVPHPFYRPIFPRWVTVNPSGDFSPYPSARSNPAWATQSAPRAAKTGRFRPTPAARRTVPKA